MRLLKPFPLAALVLLLYAPAASAATYVVTKYADSNDGVCDADCSLREAIAAANATAANDTIGFDTNIFNVARTIVLASGEIVIANNGTLTITGPGAASDGLLTLSEPEIAGAVRHSGGSGAAAVAQTLLRAVQAHREELQGKTIVSYCTGGIRCEKAALYMHELGLTNVLQLDGGILKYFEETDGRHWQGKCFVFDEREALAPDLSARAQGA